MVRRLSQRSTKTPASGPTRKKGSAAAARVPLTAAGAQGRPRPSTPPIQTTSVVSKTQSPTCEIAWPAQSRAKLRLMSRPRLRAGAAGVAGGLRRLGRRFLAAADEQEVEQQRVGTGQPGTVGRRRLVRLPLVEARSLEVLAAGVLRH